MSELIHELVNDLAALMAKLHRLGQQPEFERFASITRQGVRACLTLQHDLTAGAGALNREKRGMGPQAVQWIVSDAWSETPEYVELVKDMDRGVSVEGTLAPSDLWDVGRNIQIARNHMDNFKFAEARDALEITIPFLKKTVAEEYRRKMFGTITMEAQDGSQGV